jgi:hypothetical protein
MIEPDGINPQAGVLLTYDSLLVPSASQVWPTDKHLKWGRSFVGSLLVPAAIRWFLAAG